MPGHLPKEFRKIAKGKHMRTIYSSLESFKTDTKRGLIVKCLCNDGNHKWHTT